MNREDLWQEGQFDALAKVGPELREQLAKWAPKAPSARRVGGWERSHGELGQLRIVCESLPPRLA